MNISLIMGFVLLIVFLISPQMLLWSIGIGIYGVPLGVLAAVLAYVPRYRRWLVSRTGYLYLSLLPGLSTTQQDELRPARLSLLSLGCLVIPSLLWWLFLWRGRTFVRSDGVENAGIYAIVGLIGLALFFRWLNKGWKFNKVDPLLGKEALKGNLKQHNSPYILHIASHGFFLPNQPVQAATQAFDIWDMMGLENIAGPARQVRSGRFEQLAEQQIENPLLRAGLALAGANTWERRGALPPLAEDDILNAEEVCGLNMQGTELVVLSACETGLGDVDQRFGEGVFGLRRAFMLAGAKTLVMSLWNVPDEQTQQLMNNFYRFMLGPARLGRAEALRSAQLELKSQYPHPYYWGAFICQGDPRPLQ